MPMTFTQLWPGIFLLVAALAAASDFSPTDTRRDAARNFADYDICAPARPCEPEPVAAR